MEKRKIELLDLIIILVKKKKLLLIQSFIVLIIAYLLIFFFITPEYDSTAVIIPSNQNNMGGISSLLSSFSNLPINIPGVEGNTGTDLFETIIFSRTTAVIMIKQFNLKKDYGLTSLEKTIKQFNGNVSTLELNSSAYSISIRASSPKKSAEMTNYLVDLLNKTVVDLDIKKAKENKEFLQKRYQNIKTDLKSAEDSLTDFQNRTGVLIVDDQIKATIETITTFETELAKKEMELTIFRKLLGVKNPEIKQKEIALKVYQKKFEDIKNGKTEASILLPLKSIPTKAMQYLRLYRNVKIYNELLKFILPLYEQAKIDVQKKIPTLQIIDMAAPPEKKSYPSRILFALIIMFLIELLTVIWLLISDILENTNNKKLLFIKSELFNFKRKNSIN